MRILAYSYRPFLHGSTDVDYIRSLTALGQAADMSVRVVDNGLVNLTENAAALSSAARRRLFNTVTYSPDRLTRLQRFALRRERRRLAWDVLYTNSRIADGRQFGPVVRFDYIHEPNRTENPQLFEKDVTSKRAAAQRCAAIQVSTPSQKRLFEAIGVPPHKVFVVPFYLPYLTAATEEAVAAKHRAEGPLRVVFVGHQARRKGLDALLAAMHHDALDGARVELTVVSGLIDGAIDVANTTNTVHFTALTRREVLAQMASAHVLCVPSRRETFGLVYVEAMAQGTIPILGSGPQQVDISGDGAWGFPLGPAPGDIAATLRNLALDRDRRTNLALAARRAFRTIYAPDVVARQHHALFQAALDRA